MSKYTSTILVCERHSDVCIKASISKRIFKWLHLYLYSICRNENCLFTETQGRPPTCDSGEEDKKRGKKKGQ